MKLSLVIFLICVSISCQDKFISLGSDFELGQYESGDEKSIILDLKYIEVMMLKGPILRLGYNSNYIAAETDRGIYFFSKNESLQSKPPNKRGVVRGPFSSEEYTSLKKSNKNLPNLE